MQQVKRCLGVLMNQSYGAISRPSQPFARPGSFLSELLIFLSECFR